MDETLLKHGMISWSELMTSDLDAAKKFYGQLFGWELEPGPDMAYTMVKSNGREIAGMMAIPAEAEAPPPNWGIYVTVDNVDATARKAEQMGAKNMCAATRHPAGRPFLCTAKSPGGVYLTHNVRSLKYAGRQVGCALRVAQTSCPAPSGWAFESHSRRTFCRRRMQRFKKV
jgi:predicted enzyme related to lactoylglutathione lyase